MASVLIIKGLTLVSRGGHGVDCGTDGSLVHYVSIRSNFALQYGICLIGFETDTRLEGFLCELETFCVEGYSLFLWRSKLMRFIPFKPGRWREK